MIKKIVLSLLILGVLFMGKSTIYAEEKLEKATLAGGCFWCIEADLEKLEGVVDVVSGYAGGQRENPSYKEVSSGGTGHREAVLVSYDPNKTTYGVILDTFWRKIDPTDSGGQFCDRGVQYASAIFYHNVEQKKLAEQTKIILEKAKVFDKPIVTEIIKFSNFYKAEEYHKNYYKKSPLKYKFYRFSCGRDRFLEKAWKGKVASLYSDMSSNRYQKLSEKELKDNLTPLQYKVTQKNGTEPAFRNEYWDNKKSGIYVDLVSGEPLFSSSDKFDSKTGWPSFSKPLEPGNIVEKEDRVLFVSRSEVRSKHADSHLGHIFEDGPQPTGLRYCINSAALRFIPKGNLEKEGYAEYAVLFESKEE